MFIPESKNWQCFSRLMSCHFPPCFDHVLCHVSRAGYNIIAQMYYNRDLYTFDCIQDHMTKNQPMAAPV